MRRLDPADYFLIAAAAAAVLALIDSLFQPQEAAQAWLAAWLFWMGLPVGALFLVLSHALTGGRWGDSLAPTLRDMIRTLPWIAVLVVLILAAAPAIYPWADDGHGWLSWPFFGARAIVYLLVWNAVGWRLLRAHGPDAVPRSVAWIGLIAVFLTTSLAGFDWVMTLEPRWTSTIFGLLITAGWVLAGLAAAILLGLARGGIADKKDRDALGRLLLALAILWAYLAAVQLIVIWESDLAHEVPWLVRRDGNELLVAAAFVLLQFVVPFFMLLWPPVRRSRAALGFICAAVLAGHLVETWWLTVPDFSRPFGVAEPLLAFAIGCGILFLVARRFVLPPLPPALRLGHERR